MRGLVGLAVAIACGAHTVAESAETAANQPNEADSAPSGVEALVEDEVTRAAAYSAVGDACVAACASSYALLCLRITTICATATVVTIGSTSVPCSAAIAASCIGGAALAAICDRRCPP